MANTKYTPEQAAALVASDEPTFILRAKDALSVGIIKAYKDLLLKKASEGDGDYEAAARVREVEVLFMKWQSQNQDKVQQPTI